MAEFLFELVVEEVPVSNIPDIMDQLLEGFTKGLFENHIGHGEIETAMTNRRFLLHVNNVDSESRSGTEVIKGPSKKIAFDENGQPTKAMEKFIEINGIDRSELIDIETDKGVYIGFNREDKGTAAITLLSALIPKILDSLTFAKTMTWNSTGKRFVRPIRNLLAVFDGETVPFEFAGISTSKSTFGHRLLSDEKIKVSSFQEYCEQMSQNFVIFSEKERKEKILSEIREIENDLGLTIDVSPEMLDYYIYNNEYPVVFTGRFDDVYLELPSEIISTFMINEKKLVPVYDSEGNLTNHFAGVSNVPDESEFVSKGNEKVIKATFEDAKFFWDKDRKDDFKSLREGLKNVMFQKDLGTFYDKTIRVREISELISELSGNSSQTENIGLAAELCKNDLLSRMVGEFPSLQGIMGGLYLKEKGVHKDIWETVYYHYEPKGFVENELENLNAGILSMGDRIDNIAGLIAKGIKISGSKDPYGIRRDASAIIKIIIDFRLNFDLRTVIDFAIEKIALDNINKDEVAGNISSLLIARTEYFLKELLFFNHDVVNSVISGNSLFVYKTYLRTKAVAEAAKNASIQMLIDMHKRIKNIARTSESFQVSESLLVGEEEKMLFEIVNEARIETEKLVTNNNYIRLCSNFIDLKPVVDNFFDKVLVMDKDRKIQENRIGILQRLNEMLLKLADFSILLDRD